MVHAPCSVSPPSWIHCCGFSMMDSCKAMCNQILFGLLFPFFFLLTSYFSKVKIKMVFFLLKFCLVSFFVLSLNLRSYAYTPLLQLYFSRNTIYKLVCLLVSCCESMCADHLACVVPKPENTHNSLHVGSQCPHRLELRRLSMVFIYKEFLFPLF